MVLFLNILLPLLMLIILAIGMWRYKKTKNKWTAVKIGVTIVVVILGYSLIQPSYIPKGKAPRMQGVTFEQKEVTIKDNLTKPKERDVNHTITVREEVKEILINKRRNK